MMVFGIWGMLVHMFIHLSHGSDADAFSWMLFAFWAVIAVCGAIKEAKR